MIFKECLKGDNMNFIKEQIKVIKERDPAITSTFEVFLYPCFKALVYYKISHYFYQA